MSAALAVAAIAVAGCGDDDEDTESAKKVEPGAAEQAKGNVNWCIGKDTTGTFSKAVKEFSSQGQVKANLIELPAAADEQRTQLVQRLQAKSSECDVLGMDVIWTAEFAAQSWLQDVSDIVAERKDVWIPSTLETAKYEDKYWALPYNTNAGFVYYRTDQVQEPPDNWQAVYSEAAKGDGIVYQGARYEGLTVNFLELLYSAGGKVLSDDGKTVEIDSPEAVEVLKFMADGIEQGAAPKAVTTYKEEESRRAFESGGATFMRNWPYAYSLGKDSKIAEDFDITTFPKFGEGEGAGVLGGYDVAISAYSKNPDGAAAFAEFLTSPDWQKTIMTEASLPSTLTKTYDDPAVQKAFPFAVKLRTAVEQAQPRPVTPVYPQVSEAIFKNVHLALQGKMAPDEAIKTMKGDIDKALQTF
ncbi:MAG: ABC transporter substrate-binding protein [Thermoleophilaceae bacterium]|nr:ABC transporter substrate-binding protein [Thermoleophilaceae bacterium]